jgi:hydroxymethylglutaryl-CoA lyase
MGEKVHIVEVGPRDGFQMESMFISTELKIQVVDLLSAAGFPRIEVTSFVSPSVIPQMRDAAEVLAGIARRDHVQLSALVPNVKGCQRAIAAKVGNVRIVVCASETYNQRNVGMSIGESLGACKNIFELAAGHKVSCEAIVALSFGCPLEGYIPETRIIAIVCKLIEMGFREVGIADSIGVANPSSVKSLLRKLRRDCPAAHYSLHVHDTRGLGLVNIMSALEEGIDTFDSSLGGLGGCPVVPGGTGNVSTEDLVNMLEETGMDTGIDLDRVLCATETVQSYLNRSLPSRILQAGTRKQLFAKARGEA